MTWQRSEIEPNLFFWIKLLHYLMDQYFNNSIDLSVKMKSVLTWAH